MLLKHFSLHNSKASDLSFCAHARVQIQGSGNKPQEDHPFVQQHGEVSSLDHLEAQGCQKNLDVTADALVPLDAASALAHSSC
jgi:hypothetical protein